MEDLPIYELIIDDNDDFTGVQLVSFVDRPAMQVSAVKLSEQQQPKQYVMADTYKQYLTSAVIVPEKLIYRNDEENGKYYVKFTVEQTEKIANKFIAKTGNLSLSNKNHIKDDLIDAQLIEQWIIKDPNNDKSNALGFTDLTAGTLMMTYHVKDTKFWNEEVMTDNITGFSLEGLFGEVLVSMKEEVPAEANTEEATEDDIMAEIEKELDILIHELKNSNQNDK